LYCFAWLLTVQEAGVLMAHEIPLTLNKSVFVFCVLSSVLFSVGRVTVIGLLVAWLSYDCTCQLHL
jgi:hypothetical protein